MPRWSYRSLHVASLGVGFLLLATPHDAFADALQTVTNKEFGFTFQYPNSWVIQPAGTPNSRAKVVSPRGSPHAECAVIVQRYPQLSSLKQGDIDQLFAKSPSASEVKQALSQGYGDVTVLAVSVGSLQSRPAHMTRARYSVGTESGKMFSSGRMVSTATPGLTWTITCGAVGRSPDEAEKGYQHWQTAINSIIFSFRFK